MHYGRERFKPHGTRVEEKSALTRFRMRPMEVHSLDAVIAGRLPFN
jgi:hypothetical protein